MADTTNPVIIYSTTWCGYCGALKDFLDKKNVAWVEKDIEKDAEAYREVTEKMQGEVRGVPVSDVHGTMVLGFDRPAIEAALAK
ncbi:TPA: NrdH-redoxin [Candidatus Saccharibacteria bacterium]|nr:NrdH-redoxin [Candidatus Saccharibacteria bacterium]HRK41071.1 glutaredoxin domain-containing protein [Candidatus Saccharibacteria bacterium]